MEALKYALTVVTKNTVRIVKDLKYALTTVVNYAVESAKAVVFVSTVG